MPRPSITLLTAITLATSMLACDQRTGKKQSPPASQETSESDPKKKKNKSDSNDKSEKTSDGAKTDNTKTDGDLSQTTEGNLAANLVGLWDSGCVKSPDGTQALRTTRQYTDKDLTVLVTSFNDGNCATPIVEQKMVLSYVLGKPSDLVPGAYEIDGKVTKTTTKYLDEALALPATQSIQASAIAECRAVVYQANTEVDDTPCTTQSAEFSLIQVTGKTLKIGECLTPTVCQSAETRASKISAVSEFTKTN